MKTFIFCPLNPYPLIDVQPLTRASLSQLQISGGDRIVYHLGDNDSGDRLENVAECYRAGREMMLSGSYDAMLTVEADMIVPPDALEKMAAVDADVVYGLYVLRNPHKQEWNTFVTVCQNIGTSLSKYPALSARMWGEVMPVQGVGLGCTLIRRHVLEQIEFRLETRRNLAGRGNDWYFAVDCQWREFKQVAHLGVRCGHISGEPCPGILWPDIERRERYRIEAFHA